MKKDERAKKRDRIINTIMITMIIMAIVIPIGTVIYNPDSKLVQYATRMEEKGTLADIEDVKRSL